VIQRKGERLPARRGHGRSFQNVSVVTREIFQP
jgi:hypothetical protein